MRMDLNELDCCFFCGESLSVKPIHDDCYELQDYRYMLRQHEQQEDLKHYPGCHKVHIECANKKIDEAIIEIRHARDLADLYRYPATLRSFEKWLESLGEK